MYESNDEYIGIPQRLTAFLLDALLLSICYIIILFSILETMRAASSFAVLFLSGRLTLYLLLITALLYFPIMESSSMQATIGKRLLRIKVADIESCRVRLTTTLLRNLLKPISALTIVGWLVIPFTKRKQALHDMICGTVVVKAEPKGKA